ncbi:MAG: ABC transporter permease subunit [Kangiellaceae bacterium]|jgi:phosphate transport system permease protein|nr:ABC transporter permease subunit [Kangiellaceae bacterium]
MPAMSESTTDYDSVKDRVRALLDKQTDSGRHTIRRIKDILARYVIAGGGVAVIIAVVMIFFYLLYVVLPIFTPAELELQSQYPSPQTESVIWGVEEYGEIGFSLNRNGQWVYFDTYSGEIIKSFQLPLNNDDKIAAANWLNKSDEIVAIALESGRLLFVKQHYQITYPDDKRAINPHIIYPYGEHGISLAGLSGVKLLAVATGDDAIQVAAVDNNNQLSVTYLTAGADHVAPLVATQRQSLSSLNQIDYLLQDPMGKWLYALNRVGEIVSYHKQELFVERERKLVSESQSKLVDAQLLLGGISLLLANDRGEIDQWFPVRDSDDNFTLTKIRSFLTNQSAITTLIAESRKKGFITISADNQLNLFYTPSQRQLLSVKSDKFAGDIAMAIDPRSKTLLVRANNSISNWQLTNEHPDLSWSALWNKVWYEDYPEPDYVWQSSASSNQVEAKFSLVPLSFGTLKAAFYAMLFAMPLAICGAIYTAYFMAPSMRDLVKPAIEIMEALPTVILGFLAGLWLAPAVEDNLPGILLLLIALPLSFIVFGFAWYNLPSRFTAHFTEGFHALLILPVVIFIVWFCLSISAPVEDLLFGGDMRIWLGNNGIDYDQRNALVVGIAMGFAVIPTIFSIAEDSIYSVPRTLTDGSLALGASQWQSLVSVVLPTASPGIFSAVMIGLGRAVGETMIVLMATGNTPIMDANIFEGMRTLSATIAIETPESEVNSSHYRVLFLAGFVLFIFTFIFNTLAENVRHRLRRKYGSL